MSKLAALGLLMLGLGIAAGDCSELPTRVFDCTALQWYLIGLKRYIKRACPLEVWAMDVHWFARVCPSMQMLFLAAQVTYQYRHQEELDMRCCSGTMCS